VSTGPKTEQGKAVVRYNARTHGILSPSPVIPGVEREEDWVAYRDGIFDELQPHGQLELTLAERAALSFWRMGRVTRFEVAAIVGEIRFREGQRSRSKQSNPVQEWINWLVKQLGTVQLLSTTGEMEVVIPQHAVEVIEAACAVTGHDPHDPESALARANPQWLTQHSWLAKDLHAIIASIIKPVSDSGDNPIAVLGELLRTEVARVRADLEQRQREQREQRDRDSWQALLPSDSLTQRVARYEAHLARQAFQALHELEALQARRQGHSAPLARLDVSGDLQP
jgi:hypothetical protein